LGGDLVEPRNRRHSGAGLSVNVPTGGSVGKERKSNKSRSSKERVVERGTKKAHNDCSTRLGRTATKTIPF